MCEIRGGLEGQKCTPKYSQGDLNLLQPKRCGFVLLVNYFYTTRFVTRVHLSSHFERSLHVPFEFHCHTYTVNARAYL